jgi:hypothetical protein
MFLKWRMSDHANREIPREQEAVFSETGIASWQEVERPIIICSDEEVGWLGRVTDQEAESS